MNSKSENLAKIVRYHAVGKWDFIFKSLNIDVGNGKPKPCPNCQGKDRFRYDNKEDRGTYYCNVCGAGDGLRMVSLVDGSNLTDASKKVASLLSIPLDKKPIKQNSNADKADYLETQTELKQHDYLTQKGLYLDVLVSTYKSLQGRLFLKLMNATGKTTGYQTITQDGVKLISKGANKKGSFIVIHATNDAPNGTTATGAKAIELIKSGKQIIICEGFATGLSILSFDNKSLVICSLDAGNLLPVAQDIKKLNSEASIIIGADNDISTQNKNTGLIEAIRACNAIGCAYSIPPTDKKADWDDYRQEHGATEAKKVFFDNVIKPEQEPEQDDTKEQIKLSQLVASQRAEILLSHFNNNIIVDPDDRDNFYIYNGNKWEAITHFKLGRAMAEIYEARGENYTDNRINSTVDCLKWKAGEKGETIKNVISFNNGVYFIKTKEFKPHRKDYYLTFNNGIDFIKTPDNFDFDSKLTSFNKWLKNVSSDNEVKKDTILAGFYMILTCAHNWQLFIEVTGAGGTGKSIYAKIAQLLAGEENTASTNIDELDTPKGRYPISNATLILLPDQPKYVGEATGLKNITGGDPVAIEAKYKNGINKVIKAVVVMINNEPAIFTERAGGVSRRRVIFAFNEIISSKDRDINLIDKIKLELPYIVQMLMSRFNNPDEARHLLDEQRKSAEALKIRADTDYIYQFSEYLEVTDQKDGLRFGNNGAKAISTHLYLYPSYLMFIRNSNAGKPLSLQRFKKALIHTLKEKGITYQDRRDKKGNITNLKLKQEAFYDWFDEDYRGFTK